MLSLSPLLSSPPGRVFLGVTRPHPRQFLSPTPAPELRMISANEAIDLVEDRACLVDGTITPCWSYPGHQELWSRKHGTTGFNSQVVCLLDGEPCASTTLFLGAPMMLKRSLLHRFLGSGHELLQYRPHDRHEHRHDTRHSGLRNAAQITQELLRTVPPKIRTRDLQCPKQPTQLRATNLFVPRLKQRLAHPTGWARCDG
jgi:hypothetical protein